MLARAQLCRLGKKVGWGGLNNPDALDVFVFPGADGAFELYEDDGDSNYYLDGKHATTRFKQTWNDKKLVLQILPAEGDVSQVPSRRGYDLHFRGINDAEIGRGYREWQKD